MAVTEQSYTGNGSTTNYSFTFPYLKSTDVTVQVDQAVTTAWTFANATTVQFNTAPANGAAIKILRKTNVDNLTATFYAGSAIKSEDLNDNFTQNLYVTQEVGNRSFENTGLSTMIGNLQMGEDTEIIFEGATDNAHETTLTVVDPTADRTITLPDVTGTVVTTGDTGTVTATMLAANSVDSSELVDGSIDTVHIANNAVTTDKIGADAVDGTKIGNRSINSEHIALTAVDTEHIADSQVTTAKIADDAITDAKLADAAVKTANILDANVTTAKIADANVTTAKIADGAITIAKIGADAVDGTKIGNRSINSEHIAIGAVDTEHIADANVTTDKLADTQVTLAKVENVADGKIIVGNGSNRPTAVAMSGDATIANTGAVTIASGAVETGMIAADAIDGTKIADNAIGSEHIAANAVGTSEIADAELTTLAGMQAGTASVLADSTALAATTAEINSICENRTSETTITDSDAKIPTSGAVVDYVAAQIAPIGGLEVIANKDSFPETQPSAGVVISIADAAGIVVNGSGTSTTPDTITTDATVTINNINSSFNSSTVAAGVGWLVTSTGSGQIYNYHKANIKESDVVQLSDDINDFNSRYRINAGEPSSNNDDGDLVWDTNADKMKVYDGTSSSWKEVTSSGDFKFLVAVDAGTTTAATFDGSDTSFDLKVATNSGSAASVTNINQLMVVLNGVVQKPNAGSWSGSGEGFYLTDSDTIRFATAPPTGSTCFIVQSGSAVSIPTPGDNTVSTAKLQNASVTAAKLATMDDHVEWADNKYAKFGDSGDLCVYHNVNSFIKDNGAGSLILDTNGLGVKFTKSGLSETMAYFITDGACELYYDNAKKLATTSSGVHITGNVNLEGELGLFNGSTDAHRYIDCGLGDDNSLTIRGCEGGDTAHETLAKFTRNGACELYYDNSKKFETKSNGVEVTGNIDISGLISIDDNQKAVFGDGHDLQIYHNGTDSYISDTGTGNLLIRGESIVAIQDGSGNNSALFNDGGAVQLYHNATEEFATKSGGVKLFGHSEQIVTALTSASTVTIDFSLSNHFSCTMGHNITFANPSTESIGQSGTITLTQDGTGSRTAAWGTQFLWAGGTAPTLTTTANAVDRIDYVVVAADKIHCVATLALD